MKVLVIGKGGREHALVWKLAQDERVETVYAAPGNAGMTQATCVPIAEDAIDELVTFAQDEQIDWTIVDQKDHLFSESLTPFRQRDCKSSDQHGKRQRSKEVSSSRKN